MYDCVLQIILKHNFTNDCCNVVDVAVDLQVGMLCK